MIDSDHQRIAFIKGLDAHGAASRRFDGYVDALSKHGIAVDPQLVANGALDFRAGAPGEPNWVRRFPFEIVVRDSIAPLRVTTTHPKSG